MTDDLAHLTCGAVARIIAERRRQKTPSRHIVRIWVLNWLKPNLHYVAQPGRFLVRPSGVEEILAKLDRPR